MPGVFFACIASIVVLFPFLPVFARVRFVITPGSPFAKGLGIFYGQESLAIARLDKIFPFVLLFLFR